MGIFVVILQRTEKMRKQAVILQRIDKNGNLCSDFAKIEKKGILICSDLLRIEKKKIHVVIL